MEETSYNRISELPLRRGANPIEEEVVLLSNREHAASEPSQQKTKSSNKFSASVRAFRTPIASSPLEFLPLTFSRGNKT